MEAALRWPRAGRALAAATVLVAFGLAGCGSGTGGGSTSAQAEQAGRQATVAGGNASRFAPVAFTVTFAHPGGYAFLCQDHASAGMGGTFDVS
jgi:hypothetical protein